MNYKVAILGLKSSIKKLTEKWMDSDTEPVFIDFEDTSDSSVWSGVLMAIVGKTALDKGLEHIQLPRREYDELFLLLADAIEIREGIPRGGTRRMVRLARLLGKVLALSPNELWLLEHSCALRDIGKLKISNEVLLKKTVLTYDEWVLLKSHAQLGAELLKELGIFPELVDIISAHHESYDGDGYPRGLEGEQIPYLARILKVLDVYCAMTSPRSYRKHVATQQEALSHLQEERGKHFDPNVVDAFLNANIVEQDKDM